MAAADDLRAAVQLARQALAEQGAHPIWLARLFILEKIIIWAMREGTAPADYWAAELAQAEQQVDAREKR